MIKVNNFSEDEEELNLRNYTDKCNKFLALNITEGCYYDAKVKVVSRDFVKIYNTLLDLEFTMTKTLFVKYLLGESWMIVNLRNEFERKFLEMFDTADLELDIKLVFKFKDSQNSTKNVLSFSILFDPSLLKEIISDIEDQDLAQVINKRIDLLYKVKEELSLYAELKERLPYILKKAKDLKTENMKLIKKVEVLERSKTSFWANLFYKIKNFFSGFFRNKTRASEEI